ncbi:MAG: nickel-dependent hydrogenase large subunit [Candidatus Brockarchaeota archaeon]|nr:nickel-dependent hydrogenase large subunit [Candidatus Brockarchaeota archaeon]
MDLEVDEATRVAGHVGLRIIVGKERVKARVVHKEFRGFETLLRNRLLEEAPLYASRVCGICQVSHALASVEAIEDGLGIGVPFEAKKLREVANLAGTVQSHLLHLFLLIAPSCLKAVAAAPTGRPAITGIDRLVVEGRGIAQQIVRQVDTPRDRRAWRVF